MKVGNSTLVHLVVCRLNEPRMGCLSKLKLLPSQASPDILHEIYSCNSVDEQDGKSVRQENFRFAYVVKTKATQTFRCSRHAVLFPFSFDSPRKALTSVFLYKLYEEQIFSDYLRVCASCGAKQIICCFYLTVLRVSCFLEHVSSSPHRQKCAKINFGELANLRIRKFVIRHR